MEVTVSVTVSLTILAVRFALLELELFGLFLNSDSNSLESDVIVSVLVESSAFSIALPIIFTFRFEDTSLPYTNLTNFASASASASDSTLPFHASA